MRRNEYQNKLAVLPHHYMILYP